MASPFDCLVRRDRSHQQVSRALTSVTSMSCSRACFFADPRRGPSMQPRTAGERVTAVRRWRPCAWATWSSCATLGPSRWLLSVAPKSAGSSCFAVTNVERRSDSRDSARSPPWGQMVGASPSGPVRRRFSRDSRVVALFISNSPVGWARGSTLFSYQLASPNRHGDGGV